MRGKIIKGVAGFYYVYAEDQQIYACKAKGIFRKRNEKPLVGDRCLLDVTDPKDMEGNVTELLPRKNELIRPNVANIDQALLVFAATHPEPNLMMLDKLMVQYGLLGIPSIICFNKKDLAEQALVTKLSEVYEKAAAPVCFISALCGEGLAELRELLYGRTTSVAGPSGVGKSTLINCLQDQVVLETGDISRKSERGKHTTRHSEIFPIAEDTFIMDTPGFSSFELYGMEAEELAGQYPEFSLYNGCYYNPCSHTHEPDCAVKAALERGEINAIRYQSYTAIYGELKQRRRY
ncbi:MAG: ribosome small subunit-dependent GTPase A [Lachnospiraceae bacterium]|nr:ribosome small subunit-dependent GTPase A [Lachnospiraceae bacterium]